MNGLAPPAATAWSPQMVKMGEGEVQVGAEAAEPKLGVEDLRNQESALSEGRATGVCTATAAAGFVLYELCVSSARSQQAGGGGANPF